MIEKTIRETSQHLDKALQLADDTQCVEIGEGLLTRSAEFFKRYFKETACVLIADENTYEAAGRAVEASFRAENGLRLRESLIFSKEEFHTDAEHVAQVRRFLEIDDAVPVAVGSGTINDIVKRAAFECGRSYMIVATAVSVDGYTSFGASVDVDGFKQTLSCPAPKVVLLDLDVLARAPKELNAAGYADLIAKVPAGADWILADFVGTEPIHQTGWSLAQDYLRNGISDPRGIDAGDKAALCRLSEGLILSGLAMQVAKTSRTASGAEHLFSHLWDNQGHTFNGKVPFHGFKVGIGTIATSRLYEKVLEYTEADFVDAGKRVESFYRPWNVVEQAVEKHFGNVGGLAKQVLEQNRQKHVSLSETKRRFESFAEHWPELREKLRKQLLPADEIREMLRLSGAPSESEKIGISRERLHLSYEQAQLIRCRYNVLDFVLETGNWERSVVPLF